MVARDWEEKKMRSCYFMGKRFSCARWKSSADCLHNHVNILNPTELYRCAWWLSGKESAWLCRRRGYDPWVGKIPWRRKWQPTPVFFFFFLYFNWRTITLQYCGGFCHTLTWISHGCTCVPHPEHPPFHLPPSPIPLGHPSAPALSTLSHASTLDCQSISHMLIYMFQCYSLKSFHPCLLPQSPKVCSLHLCLFCYLVYRVIVIIFLNSIYMR